MSVHFGELAMKFGADGVISPGEVLALRREAWPDGHISQAEAEAIVRAAFEDGSPHGHRRGCRGGSRPNCSRRRARWC